MPLFEYRCGRCRSQFELLVRSRDERVACPDCRSDEVEKLLSAAVGRAQGALPIASSCPPPSAGPCGPGCCRLPS